MENNPAQGKELSISTPKVQNNQVDPVITIIVNALVHDNPVVPDFIIEKPSTDASPQSSEIEKPSSDATTKEVKEKCDECIFEVNFKIDLKTHKKKNIRFLFVLTINAIIVR